MTCTPAHQKSQALSRDTRMLAGRRQMHSMSYFERVTGRLTVFSSQQGKKQSYTSCSVRELIYPIRCSGFSFKAHWKQRLFVLFPVGSRRFVSIHKLCLWQTKEKSIYNTTGASPVEHECTACPSSGCFHRSHQSLPSHSHNCEVGCEACSRGSLNLLIKIRMFIFLKTEFRGIETLSVSNWLQLSSSLPPADLTRVQLTLQSFHS